MLQAISTISQLTQQQVITPNIFSEQAITSGKSDDQCSSDDVTTNSKSNASSDESFPLKSPQQKHKTLPKSFGSRAPDNELQQKLQQQLKKEKDPNALVNLESKLKQNTLERESNNKRKQVLQEVRT